MSEITPGQQAEIEGQFVSSRNALDTLLMQHRVNIRMYGETIALCQLAVMMNEQAEADHGEALGALVTVAVDKLAHQLEQQL